MWRVELMRILSLSQSALCQCVCCSQVNSGSNMFGGPGKSGGSGHPIWGPGQQIYGGGGGGSAWPSSPPAPGGWSSPGFGPSSGGGSNPAAGQAKQMNQATPFQRDLHSGVCNKVITICGTVNPNANKFAVDLSKESDICFHLSPRFGKNEVVANSFLRGRWGKEEKATPFPFVKGQTFEMTIHCRDNDYKVTVNGTPLMTYKHRNADLGKIKKIGIYNDVTLTNFRIEPPQ